jgi:hypothetical protein
LEKEEFKELLGYLPSENYLDKLIEAIRSWSQARYDLPDNGHVNAIIKAASTATRSALEYLPDEDYLDKVIEASKVSFDES